MDPRLVEVLKLKATVAQRELARARGPRRKVSPADPDVEEAEQKACSAEVLCVPSFAQEHSAHDTDAAMMEDERGNAIVALSGVARHRR